MHKITNNHLIELTNLLSKYNSKVKNNYKRFVTDTSTLKLPNEYLISISGQNNIKLSIKILFNSSCIVFYKTSKDKMDYTEFDLKSTNQIDKLAGTIYFILLNKLDYSLNKTFYIKVATVKTTYKLSKVEELFIRFKIDFLVFIKNLREFLGI